MDFRTREPATRDYRETVSSLVSAATQPPLSRATTVR